jgi:hypothetical protein
MDDINDNLDVRITGKLAREILVLLRAPSATLADLTIAANQLESAMASGIMRDDAELDLRKLKQARYFP